MLPGFKVNTNGAPVAGGFTVTVPSFTLAQVVGVAIAVVVGSAPGATTGLTGTVPLQPAAVVKV